MLDCIKKLKGRGKRKKWDRNKHPWKKHQPQLFASHKDVSAHYDFEKFSEIIRDKKRNVGKYRLPKGKLK